MPAQTLVGQVVPAMARLNVCLCFLKSKGPGPGPGGRHTEAEDTRHTNAIYCPITSSLFPQRGEGLLAHGHSPLFCPTDDRMRRETNQDLCQAASGACKWGRAAGQPEKVLEQLRASSWRAGDLCLGPAWPLRPEAPSLGVSGRLQGAGPGTFISWRKGSPRAWSPRSFLSIGAVGARAEPERPGGRPVTRERPPAKRQPWERSVLSSFHTSGVSGHFINSSPRGEASPPGPSSPALWAWPSDLGASLGGTVGGHRHPACPEAPGTAEGKSRFQRSHFLPPAINCKTQRQLHNSSWGRKATALTLYFGTATHLILRNTQDERGRGSALQRKSCLKPSGPIDTQRKIWKVSPLIWTFPPSSAQQTSR